MSKTCFICLEKEQNFNKKGQTFRQHIKYQHNLWNYLYYFIYLRNKLNNHKLNTHNINTHKLNTNQNKNLKGI